MHPSDERKGGARRDDVFVAPLDDARRGTLELRRPLPRIGVRAAVLDALGRATFEGRPPRAWTQDGILGLEYPRFRLPGQGPHSATVELNVELPWALLVVGGLREATFELDGLELTELVVQGGVADLELVLPTPQARVPVRIAGGASNVRILRPAGVAATLGVGGGASRLVFDEERYGAIGGETLLETPGGSGAREGYEIVVEGGASRLTVSEEARGEP